MVADGDWVTTVGVLIPTMVGIPIIMATLHIMAMECITTGMDGVGVGTIHTLIITPIMDMATMVITTITIMEVIIIMAMVIATIMATDEVLQEIWEEGFMATRIIAMEAEIERQIHINRQEVEFETIVMAIQ
ncbi:hypothetical protein FLBR109950_09485 [Flavobacterium branchiophilum]